MKTSELTGALLDYWVARAEGLTPFIITGRSGNSWVSLNQGQFDYLAYSPSFDWSKGGPIIERERIKLMPTIPTGQTWYATMSRGATLVEMEVWRGQADAPLVAAMRAYVASKFGDEVQDVEGGA